MEQIVRTFVVEKETKNTKKFQEVEVAGEPVAIGSLYVQKEALEGLGNPDRIKLAITVA